MIKSAIAKEDNDILCSLSATKRMLATLGISSTSRCLLQRKRDISQLVTSYLEKKSSEREFDILDELRELYSKGSALTKRGKRYCCSPACDPFMARLGYPTADVLRCVS